MATCTQEREDLSKKLDAERVRRDVLVEQRNTLGNGMAVLIGDIIAISRATTHKQQEYIEHMRQKESIIRDIDNVDKQLRKIVTEQNQRYDKKPLELHMDADVYDELDTYYCGGSSSSSSGHSSKEKLRIDPIAHLGGNVYVCLLGDAVDIRKWSKGSDNKPAVPVSSKDGKGAGVTMDMFNFEEILAKRPEIDAALSAPNKAFFMHMHDDFRVYVSGNKTVSFGKPCGFIELTREQWKILTCVKVS